MFTDAVIICLMVPVLTLYLHHVYSQLHADISYENYASELHSVQARFDHEFGGLVTLSNMMANSPNVAPFRFEDNPVQYTLLQRNLLMYQACNDFFEHIYLLFNTDHFILSARSTSEIDRFVDSGLIFRDIEPDTIKDLMRNADAFSVLPASDTGGFVFSLTEPKANWRYMAVAVPFGYTSGSSVGRLMFLINEQRCFQIISQSVNTPSNCYLLSEDKLLLAKKDYHVEDAAVFEALTLSGGAENGGEVTLGGERYMLFSEAGSVSSSASLRYVMLVSSEQTRLAVQNSLFISLMLICGVTMLILLLFRVILQRRVTPIEVLHSMVADGNEGNELDTIRRGVEQLIRSREESTQYFQYVEPLHRSDFAQKFIRGYFKTQSECIEAAKRAGLDIAGKSYCLLMIARPTSSDYRMIPHQLDFFLERNLTGGVLPLSEASRALVLLFFSDAQAALSEIDRRFRHFKAQCPGATGAMSGVHQDLPDVQLAYLEVNDAFETRFVHGNEKLICFTGEEQERDTSEYSKKRTEHLRNALKAGELAGAYNALSDIAQYMRSAQLSMFEFKRLYNDMINVIINEANTADGNHTPITYDLFALSDCLSIEDLNRMLHGICKEIIAHRIDMDRSDLPPEIIRAREMINRRACNADFSVSEVAEEMDMRDSKFSIEFRRAYNMTPFEYLTKRRMLYARQLLLETDMSVKDIAIACGYYDPTAFNRRFKAMVGMTAQQYRQHNINTK